MIGLLFSRSLFLYLIFRSSRVSYSLWLALLQENHWTCESTNRRCLGISIIRRCTLPRAYSYTGPVCIFEQARKMGSVPWQASTWYRWVASRSENHMDVGVLSKAIRSKTDVGPWERYSSNIHSIWNWMFSWVKVLDESRSTEKSKTSALRNRKKDKPIREAAEDFAVVDAGEHSLGVFVKLMTNCKQT